MNSPIGRVSRRALLVGGLGLATAACGARVTTAAGSQPRAGRTVAAGTTSDSGAHTPKAVVRETVRSKARGTAVELVTMRPEGVTGDLPVCIALHGRGGSAASYIDLGIPEMLTAAVNAGVKPFAVAALDGGDTYWVVGGKKPQDDPQKMLLEELPEWLGTRGFRSKPFAAFGISMGGYGALNYARNPGINAVAGISAAMFAAWSTAKTRNVFKDQAHWEATEPLKHIDAIAAPLGVWCGASDPFVAPARQLISKAHPKVAAIIPGAHDANYWRRVLPDVLRFVGETV